MRLFISEFVPFLSFPLRTKQFASQMTWLDFSCKLKYHFISFNILHYLLLNCFTNPHLLMKINLYLFFIRNNLKSIIIDHLKFSITFVIFSLNLASNFPYQFHAFPPLDIVQYAMWNIYPSLRRFPHIVS